MVTLQAVGSKPAAAVMVAAAEVAAEPVHAFEVCGVAKEID
jgi:hypothetical protein